MLPKEVLILGHGNSQRVVAAKLLHHPADHPLPLLLRQIGVGHQQLGKVRLADATALVGVLSLKL